MPLGYGIECVRIPHCVSLSSLRTCVVRARLRASDLASDGASGVLRLGAQHCFLFGMCSYKTVFTLNVLTTSMSMTTGYVFHQVWRR